jgi:hypothetical protein
MTAFVLVQIIDLASQWNGIQIGYQDLQAFSESHRLVQMIPYGDGLVLSSTEPPRYHGGLFLLSNGRLRLICITYPYGPIAAARGIVGVAEYDTGFILHSVSGDAVPDISYMGCGNAGGCMSADDDALYISSKHGDLGNSQIGRAPGWSYNDPIAGVSVPLVTDDAVIIQGGGVLKAFCKDDGSLAWQNADVTWYSFSNYPRPRWTNSLVWSRGCVGISIPSIVTLNDSGQVVGIQSLDENPASLQLNFAVSGNQLIVPYTDHVESYQPRWTYKHTGNSNVSIAVDLAVSDGLIYAVWPQRVLGYDGTGKTWWVYKNTLTVIDAAVGRDVWVAEFPESRNPVTAIVVQGRRVSVLQSPFIYQFVRTVLPDFDGDGDVDLVDFAHLASCFAGPNRPPRVGCEDADFDNDGDVDLDDYAIFRSCFNGPNRPPTCE